MYDIYNKKRYPLPIIYTFLPPFYLFAHTPSFPTHLPYPTPFLLSALCEKAKRVFLVANTLKSQANFLQCEKGCEKPFRTRSKKMAWTWNKGLHTAQECGITNS